MTKVMYKFKSLESKINLRQKGLQYTKKKVTHILKFFRITLRLF